MLRPEQRSELQKRKILQSNGDVGRWEREGREARGGEGRRGGKEGREGEGMEGREGRKGVTVRVNSTLHCVTSRLAYELP